MSHEIPPEGERREAGAEPEDATASPAESPTDAADAGGDDPHAGASVRGGPRFALWLAFAALVVAAAGSGGSVYLWWQTARSGGDAESRAASAEASLASLRGTLAEIEARTAALEEADAGLREALIAARDETQDLDERLDRVPAEIAMLEERVDGVIGGTFDSRASWLRAEAIYYLNVANTELTLANNWDNAIRALELADDRLAEAADPALSVVRRLIAEELLALESVPRPDLEGLSFTLSGIAARAGTLPLRDGPAPNLRDEPADLDEAEPGVGRFWESVKGALSGIVRVERSDEPVRPALSADERRLVRRQLVVELELARLALIRGQPSAFAGSLAAARALLEADFDTASPAVAGALAALADLEAVEIRPEPPDIGNSLNALRNLTAGDD